MLKHCTVVEDLRILCKEGPLSAAVKAAELFQHQSSGLNRNDTYILLQTCERQKDLQCGRRVYSLMIHNGLNSFAALADHLIRLLSYHGCLAEANQIFLNITNPSPYSWTAIISANAKLGRPQVALQLYQKMELLGLEGDRHIYLCALKACMIAKDLLKGRTLHFQIIKKGLQSDVILGSCLLNMYATCGHLDEACKVFDNSQYRDVVFWNTMIAGYVQHGEHSLALQCFERMQQEGIMPNVVSWNSLITGYAQGEGHMALECFGMMQKKCIDLSDVTFLSILKACSAIGSIEQGRLIHDKLIKSNLQVDVVLWNTLIDMYAKCGSLKEACLIFDNMQTRDVVSWNAMMTGYVQHGDGGSALDCFERMLCGGIRASEITFPSVLKACASTNEIGLGRLTHNRIMERCAPLDMFVGNSLIDMYAKCGSLEEAHKAFNDLPNRDIVSWNTMITGCAQSDAGILSLEFFAQMQQEGVKPNTVTYLSVLKTCANLGALGQGRSIHRYIMESGFESDMSVGNCLVDMYAKCGSMKDANKVFNLLQSKDAISWGAMIAGYAQVGKGTTSIDLFKKMQQEGIHPDEVSFNSILVACSRAGLVDEGHWYLEFVRGCHGIATTISHCNCMVDLLGRAGLIDEAEDLLQTAMETDIMGWMSLLSACKVHGNVKAGKRCFDQIVCLDIGNTAGYVLMSNIYADAHMQEVARKMSKYLSLLDDSWVHLD